MIKSGGGIFGSKRDHRGAAELISLILLIGFITVAAVGVLVVANASMSQLEGASQDETASQSLENAKMELESLQENDVSDISFSEPMKEDTYIDSDAGHLTIRTPSGEEYDSSLGTIIYEREDNHIAYQGGGVWEYHGETSTSISRPNFEIVTDQNEIHSIHFDVTNLEGDEYAGSDLMANSDGLVETMENIPTRAHNGDMIIEIESKYYEAWGELFEEEPALEVDYEDDENKVIATLHHSSPPRLNNVLTVDGELGLGGGSSVSSYDSSSGQNEGGVGIGNYEETENGSILVSEEFDGGGGVNIEGDIYVDGDFEITGGADVTDSNIYATGDIDIGSVSIDKEVVSGGDVTVTSGGSSFEDGSEVRAAGDFTDTTGGGGGGQDDYDYSGLIHVDGEFEGSGGGAELAPSGEIRAEEVELTTALDGSVIRTEETPSIDNDRGAEIHEEDVEAPSLSGIEFIDEHADNLPEPAEEVQNASDMYESDNDNEDFDGFDESPVEITAGDYFYDGNVDYENKLMLDTSEGNINFVINGDFDSTNIDAEVIGDGEANIYVTGNFETSGGASWTNSDGAGDRLWIYTADSEDQTHIQADGFYGVVFSESAVDIGGGTNIHGAIASEGSEISGGQSIYYDEAIADSRISKTEGSDDYSYIDISVHEVAIDSDSP